MKIEHLFKILAVFFLITAAYFGWQMNKDGLFVSLVLAAVCFFLNVRFQAKGRMKQRELEK